MADYDIGDVSFDVVPDLDRFSTILDPQVRAAVERAEKRFGTLDITPDLKAAKLQQDIAKAAKQYDKLVEAGEDAEKVEAARLRLLTKQNDLVRLQAREESKLAQTQLRFTQRIAAAAEKKAKAEAKAVADKVRAEQRAAAEAERLLKRQASLFTDLHKAQIAATKAKGKNERREAIATANAIRRQLRSTGIQIEIEEPRPTVFARLTALFRRAGERASSAFGDGFGQSFRAQIFSDPQAAILKVTAALTGLTAVVTPIGPIFVGLAASLAAFAGVLGSLGIVAGVAAIGMSGFFDAVKNGGDALDGLTAPARASAESLRGLGDAWGRLQDAVQSSIFSEVGTSFDGLNKTIAAMRPGLTAIGSSIGMLIRDFNEWASSGPGIELISTTLGRVADVFERLRPGLQAFGVGLLRLFNASLPAAGDMADTFTDLGKSFERWTASLESGEVNKISQAIGVMSAAFRDLGKVFGPVLSGIGSAFESISPALDTLRKAAFPILQTLGEDIGDALKILGPVIAGIVESFADLLKVLKPLAPVLLPVLAGIAAFAAGGPVGVVAALAVAFASLAAKSEPLRKGFQDFFKVIRPVIDQGLKQLSPLVKDLGKALAELGRDLGPIAKALLRAFGPVVGAQLKFFFGLIGQAIRLVTRMVRFVSGLLRGDWTKAWKNGLALAKFFIPVTRLLTGLVNSVRTTIRNTITAFTQLRDRVGATLSGLGESIRRRGDAIGRVFRGVREAIGRVPGAFRSAAAAIGRAWDGIGSAIRSPLRDVRNNALVPFLRAIGKLPGVPDYSKYIPGFAAGGHTGPGSKYKVAGVVHADEFVMSKAARRRLEQIRPGALDYMNRTGQWPDGGKAFRRATRRARDEGGYARGGRVYPVTSRTTGRGYPGHTGVDFPVPTGTKVMSAVNGLVTAVRHLTYSYGKHIRVQGDGVETIYAHLSHTLARVGQKVSAGQLIGYSGSTGNSTGPHLHFEVRPPGTQAGTQAWLNGASTTTPHKGFSIPNPKDYLKKLGSSGFLNARTFFTDLSKDVLDGLRKKFDIFDFVFDSGGVANGKGIMHKQTLQPERVLSPAQTKAFQQMVDANFGQSGTTPSLDMQALAALLNSIQIIVQPGMDRRATAELWLNGKKYAEALA